jgi:curved DNA-binding protein CbpA
MPNCYELLEADQTADLNQLRAAYIRLAIRWHPDENSGNEQAEEAFTQISRAYAMLSNPSSRQVYDKALRTGQAEESFQSFAIDSFSPKEMFLKEMTDLAIELTMHNASWATTAEALTQKGCPAGVANTIATDVQSLRKSEVRKAASKAFIRASAALVLAIGITLISYFTAAPGTTYLVPSGLLLFFGLYFFRALYFLISGNAPKKKERSNSSKAEKEKWEAQMSKAPSNYCHICNKIYDNATICPVHGFKLTRIV